MDELVHQAGLADSGLGGHRRDLAPASSGLRKHLTKAIEFRLPPDELTELVGHSCAQHGVIGDRAHQFV